MEINVWDPNLAAFFGSFTSEGTLSKQHALKVTSKDLGFLKETTRCARSVFGEQSATNLPPTKEHKNIDDGYHKYYSKKVADFLILKYGVKSGRKVISNQGLPKFFMNSINNRENIEEAKTWLVRYLQMRYSGDGHVQTGATRRIVLTRNIALSNLDNETVEKIKTQYSKNKPVNEYPQELRNIIQTKAHDRVNYPVEFLDIKYALDSIFSIYSSINCYGVRSIYFDKNLGRHLVTGIYRLVIARKQDVIKFIRNIGFASLDVKNKQKLINLIISYKETD